ncbi:hypothetical protein Tco_0926515 [Tanacetum coccineum]|uniref:Uncharacterized protein n=1 Tax=Tanacetum coccineum TaxID=301880 RepID=A0ABQ5DA46_9ASTR
MPDTEDTITLKLDSPEIIYTVDMFRDTFYLPVETPDNPFIAPVTIKTIESFMQMVGYQGVVDKVSAFYTKFLAQPWQTMFKVFNRCLTTRISGHDQTKINILQLFHAVVNRINVDYAALLWWDLLNYKYSSIPQILDEDYHSLKDDIPLVSVYSIGNVLFQGMLIPNAFLTDKIRATDDYKKYKTVFPGSQKENLEVDDDDDVTKKKDDKKDKNEEKDDHVEKMGDAVKEKDNDDHTNQTLVGTHATGSMETKNKQMQTPIPTPN